MVSAQGKRIAACSLAALATASAVACKTPAKHDSSPLVSAAPTHEEAEASSKRVIKGKSLELVFHADPLPNLVYELDCMIGRYPCSREAYEALWTKELGFDETDRKKLDELRELRERFHGRLEVGGKSDAVTAPLPLPHADRTINARLSIASLVARTPEEHVSHLGLLTSQNDARKAQAIIDHFRPRFDAYWETKGRTLCENASRDLARVFDRESLTAHTESLAAFYGADLSSGKTTLHLHLMARPTHASIDAASQIGGHAIVEIPEWQAAEERAPVVVHELLHHLYAMAPDEKLASLARTFATTKDPFGKASYAVLDEALAVALGTAPVMQRLDPAGFSKKNGSPMGLYAEPTIDRVAKAVRPFLEATIREGKTLHDPAFVEGYLAAIHAAYPNGMPPTAHARPLVAALDPRFFSAFQALDRAAMASSLGGATATFTPGSQETLALFDGRKDFCQAFFVTHDEVPHLGQHAAHIGKTALAAIAAEAKQTPAFVYSTEGQNGAYRFVFVADDTTSMERLVRALAHQEEAFEGVLEVKTKPTRR